MMFRAGAAEAVITPPVGTLLAGYSARAGGAIGVHDDLHARAVVFDDGTTQAAIVSCDLVGIDRRLAALVRRQVHEATGIPEAHVMVCATHTHAGPVGLRPEDDAALTDTTARTIAGAIVAAHAGLRPAVLKAGAGNVDTVSQNRRHPDWPVDAHLGVLLFDAPDPREGPIASVVNFACHPTVLYSTNMLISADYPGHAVRTVKDVLGEAPVLFLNGACGNVNPSWIEQRHDEARRVGSIVGSEAARRLQELRPLGAQHKTWNIRWGELTDRAVTTGELVGEPRIRVLSRTVDAPLRSLGAPETYRAQAAELLRQRDALHPGEVEARHSLMERITMLQGTIGVAERLHAGGGVLHPEVQAIAFSPDVAVVGLPGEFFAETAQAVRAAAAMRHLFIACYTNHHVFYVVPKDAWPQGGYEPGVSWLDDTADEAFRAATLALLREIRA